MRFLVPSNGKLRRIVKTSQQFSKRKLEKENFFWTVWRDLKFGDFESSFFDQILFNALAVHGRAGWRGRPTLDSMTFVLSESSSFHFRNFAFDLRNKPKFTFSLTEIFQPETICYKILRSSTKSTTKHVLDNNQLLLVHFITAQNYFNICCTLKPKNQFEPWKRCSKVSNSVDFKDINSLWPIYVHKKCCGKISQFPRCFARLLSSQTIQLKFQTILCNLTKHKLTVQPPSTPTATDSRFWEKDSEKNEPLKHSSESWGYN